MTILTKTPIFRVLRCASTELPSWWDAWERISTMVVSQQFVVAPQRSDRISWFKREAMNSRGERYLRARCG